MTYKTEFPDFPDSDMPALPTGFEDTSWHNDSCPSMTGHGLRIWIDYVNVRLREFQTLGSQYIVLRDDDSGEPLLETDEWQEVLDCIERHQFTKARDNAQ